MVPGHYVGLMSGTSLDGVDAVLLYFTDHNHYHLVAHHYQGFGDELRARLLLLNRAGDNEIELSEMMGNQLSEIYADSVHALLHRASLSPGDIAAIGSHGQTIRHCPDLGFTVQIGNAALLAELTGIAVVADFRSRDIAAGGQGAPLVPAFHQAAFSHPTIHRVIVNIGGISNLSDLPVGGPVSGFDCGPGNLLMDAWTHRHTGQTYDADGIWASTGKAIPDLLEAMMSHPFLALPPPRSTGRDSFHMAWLETLLKPAYHPADVQATLLAHTATCIAEAIDTYCDKATEVYLCGGGAYNRTLVSHLSALLAGRMVNLTDHLGIGANLVEAAAFAWLASRTLANQPGNLPAVTGASGSRVLGAIYPA